jgi:hypothetical protein
MDHHSKKNNPLGSFHRPYPKVFLQKADTVFGEDRLMIRSIKLKTYFTFALIHFGLFFSVYWFFKLSELQMSHPEYWHYALFGSVAMYGGVVAGALFLYIPLAPWIRRIGRLLNWRNWLIEELPTLIALVPVAAAFIHILRSAWKEVKHYHRAGKLDAKAFSHIARRVADQTETSLGKKHATHTHKRKTHHKRAA